MLSSKPITPEIIKDYLDGRVNSQILWLSKKSRLNRRFYYFLKVIEILFSILIPFLVTNTLYSIHFIKFMVAFLSISVAFTTTLTALFKFQDKWTEYRSVAELLKAEKFTFITNAGIYSTSSNPASIFVERIEKILLATNQKWTNFIKTSSINNEAINIPA